MPDPINDWLEHQAYRKMELQAGKLDSAKLLTTFVAALAATFCASALESNSGRWQTIVALVLLALSTILAAAVMVLSQSMAETDGEDVMAKAKIRGLTDDETYDELQVGSLTAAISNETLVGWATLLMSVQFLIAATASAFATWSMLVGT